MSEICRGKFEGLSFACSRTEQPDAGLFGRHCHEDYELLYVKQGRGRFVVESAEYSLFPGALFLVRPDEYHYVRPDAAEPYERTVISFRRSFAAPAVQQLALLQRRSGEAGLCFRCAAAASALENLGLCGLLPAERQQILARSVMEQVLLLLSLEEPMAAEHDPLMERVMQYLTEHLTEKLGLTELSEEFFVSRSHLCRAFRRHAGVTLLDYITVKRVAYARGLLRQGVAAADCARRAGFSEYSTFYRAYCKHVGHTPSAEKRG